MLASAAVRVALAALAVAAPPASPSPGESAPASANLADFYTADRSTSASHSEFELRLRDDGTAWLVTVAAGATHGTFETGTWHADGPTVRVDLDTTAGVVSGAPADTRPETRSLSLAVTACTLTVSASTPANALGEPAVAFVKRHCP